MRTDAECPSLSPDGTRVAYKKRGDRATGEWRLAVLDLATGKETLLAERRSVDDQVEWLDDDRILYGLPGRGSDAARVERLGGPRRRLRPTLDPHPPGVVARRHPVKAGVACRARFMGFVTAIRVEEWAASQRSAADRSPASRATAMPRSPR